MKLLSVFRKKKKHPAKFGWFGNYPSWLEAKKLTSGYEAKNILETTKKSLLLVKSGEAVYERDSVLFDTKEYPYAVIAALLYTAMKNGNKLHVIDFGGSLGTTWYQVKDFIPAGLVVTWAIVEQPAYVTEGRKYFEDDQLKFYYTIEECLKEVGVVHLIFLSGVVQNLEDPHAFLEELVRYPVNNILFDRTTFIKDQDTDRLTVQVVSPEIYDAQYPVWFFNEACFLHHFQSFNIKTEFFPYVEGEKDIAIDDQFIAYGKGFFFERKIM
nr:methyltransferase, TIGR04325 family [uncultured Chitinophaga sp.]